jgi:hypothetical protein
MGFLGFLYSKQGRDAESEASEKQIYPARRKVLGELHPATLLSLNNLAGSHLQFHRLDEAERLAKQVLEGREKVLGPTSPYTLRSACTLGVIYRSQGRLTEAEAQIRPAFDAQRKALGETHPDTIKSMKKGAILINHSRGDVVDLDALRKALKSGKLAGAAVDVFPEEPEKTCDAFSCALQNLQNVILTPHIGGSTEEAQANIGLDVTSKLVKYLELGNTEGSHTVPPVSLPPQAGTHRILHIHRNIPGVLGDINGRAAIFPAQRRALADAQDDQQDRGNDPGAGVGRQQADGEGRSAHQADRGEEGRLAPDAVAHHPEQDRAERAKREARGEQPKRGDQRRGRVEPGEEHFGNDLGEAAEDEEVIPFERRSRRRGGDDLGHRPRLVLVLLRDARHHPLPSRKG